MALEAATRCSSFIYQQARVVRKRALPGASRFRVAGSGGLAPRTRASGRCPQGGGGDGPKGHALYYHHHQWMLVTLSGTRKPKVKNLAIDSKTNLV